MKPKKKEKVIKAERNEADIEKWLQTFTKPTQIYRYLRTRHLVSPLFLQRNLWYMKHRRKPNPLRKSFKVDSLLEKKKPVQEENSKQCVGSRHLRLDLEGFYDDHLPQGVTEVEVEAILTRIQHTRKHGDEVLNVKPTSLGKVNVPVNPNWTKSSLDGTQCEESTEPCLAKIISKDGLTFQPHDGQHSISLHLSVTCHLSLSVSNGGGNGDNADEPASKKRRNVPGSNPSRLEENVVVYGAELSLYGRQHRCLLDAGMYDLILQEQGSKFSTQGTRWETAAGKRPIDVLEVFDTSPTLKFKLSWTDDAEGLKPSTIPPCEYARNNNYPTSGSDSSSLQIKEEGQSTPQKKIQVVYNFLYDENTRQQTDAREDLVCPWCTINSGDLYSLLKHLRLCHPRLNFIYTPTPTGHQIDVSLNDCYDGAYAGNPQDLNSHLGFAFHRLGPVQRTSITHVIVYRPKIPSQTLQEFFEPEKENQVCRQIIQGHNRLYYRTITCQPLKPQEVNQDSEDEVTPGWLCQKSVNLIDEFTDVNEGEKELMKMWNTHCMKYAYIADCQIGQACQSFLEEHGREVVTKNIVKNFILHLSSLYDYSLISLDIVQRSMWQLYTVQDDLETAGLVPTNS
ncbi:polycomb protein suz12-like [Mya arenaria]|uniref:polycomb protein suz12-like n=1 Tax=Mya arenaria TaxID=6604 RepID=UPI0022E5D7BC|nr:polycomb protein suz12-like [Mya arenaria]